MEKRLLLYLLISFILAAANLEESLAAKTRHYKFEVAYIYWSPDCEERMTIGINGRFPGPTIRAKAGDTIVVELKNGFYHGHYGMQRAAGLYGSLIVDSADGEKEPFHYDGEHNLLLSDWWHESVHAQMLGLSSIPFRWVGEPQAILINGRGQYNCSLAAHLTGGTSSCKITNKQCAPVVFKVRPNKTYRLRISSTTSLSSLNLKNFPGLRLHLPDRQSSKSTQTADALRPFPVPCHSPLNQY